MRGTEDVQMPAQTNIGRRLYIMQKVGTKLSPSYSFVNFVHRRIDGEPSTCARVGSGMGGVNVNVLNATFGQFSAIVSPLIVVIIGFV